MLMQQSPRHLSKQFVTAYKALLVARSGLFNARHYCEANPDVPTSRPRAIWHFIRHAATERRPTNQPALSTWLLPKILDKTVSPRQARRAQKALKHANNEGEIKAALTALPCNSHGYFYHAALADHEFTAAYDIIPKLPNDERILARHYFAVRHLRLNDLEAAVTDAFQRLSATDVSSDELIAIRDFYEISGCQGRPRADFYQVLLTAMLQACDRENRCPNQPLWWAGLPFVVASAAQNNRLLASTTKTAQLSPPPSTARDMADLLSLSASNALMNEQMWICTKTGQIVPAQPKVPNACLTLWLPAETQWRQADTNTLQSGIIDAFKFILEKATTHFEFISPVTATGVFDLRHSSRDQSPFLGYHTITNPDQRALNFKESALPGYYLFDAGGYSGWATTPDLTARPQSLSKGITLDKLQRQFVDTRKTKYEQAPTTGPLPKNFVLIALQVPDDTVASLSYIKREDLISTTAQHYAGSETTVLVKVHPKDTSQKTKNLLKHLTKTHKNTVLTTAPIHDLLSHTNLVIIANSGVGFEALLHSKPVITTGKSDYDPCTKAAHSTEALAAALNEIDCHPERYPCEDLKIYFLESYISNRTFSMGRMPTTLDDNFNRMKRLKKRPSHSKMKIPP